MRKTIIIAAAVAVCVLAVAATLIVRPKIGETGTFVSEEWADMIQWYTDNTEFAQEVEARSADYRFAQPIATAEEAVDAALEVWHPIYGEDLIAGQRPYNAFYDADSDTWLVHGTVRADTGGAAGILLQKDGTILAVWHER